METRLNSNKHNAKYFWRQKIRLNFGFFFIFLRNFFLFKFLFLDLNKLSSMKILIATDVHCGYGENKKYLYEDSFDTFEEVLEKANDHQCDFVLLGEVR